METDVECSLILELPENDPLFKKKKVLLQNKGFGCRECIYFKNALSTPQIHTTLEVMLQISRIIHLDEAEVYFDGSNMHSQVDFYSPRNELESLNSILSLIDILLLRGKHNGKNALQDLRDETLKGIRDFGEKYRVESRIVENCSCEKEMSLLEWGESNGVRSKLQISYVEGAGRGAVSIEDLEVGDIALEIPLSIIISEDLVHESDMFPILEKIDGISSETMLLLWSMKERYNFSSKFKIYFDTLPEDFNIGPSLKKQSSTNDPPASIFPRVSSLPAQPSSLNIIPFDSLDLELGYFPIAFLKGLSFGVDAIIALDGTLLLDEIIQAKEHLRVQYGQLFPALCKDHPHIFQEDIYTWEQFLWACELWYSNGMRVMFADGKQRTCLIPIAGFLNHSPYPHIMRYGRVDSATNSLKFPVSRPCSAGEQCFLSYGNFSSSHLVTFYGFLPQGDNYYDVIPLDIDAAQTDCPEGWPKSNWMTHMVRGTWLSKNHEIFHYGLPPPLLDYLRRIHNPMLHAGTLNMEQLEIEMEVLGDLLSTFGGMMGGLRASNIEERKSSSWDVKLAVEFKDVQRRIVSSIITSCYAGRGLVEGELCKCND